MQTTSARVLEITHIVSMLTDEDQEKLLKALKTQILLAEARRLDQSVKKNDVSMDEILK
jgi:hypothetical protein